MSVADDSQIERIRLMSADDRVRLAHSLWEQAWAAAAAGVWAQHPMWTEVQVTEQVRTLFRAASD